MKSRELFKLVEFCKLHVKTPMCEIPVPLRSDKMSDNVQPEFAAIVDPLDNVALVSLLLAANFTNVDALETLCIACLACRSVRMVPDGPPEAGKQRVILKDEAGLRETFNITAVFTPEDKAAALEANPWLMAES